MDFKNPLNSKKIESINEMLAQRPDYKIEQVNGQRLYDLKGDHIPVTTKDRTEVFIGRLPRDCYEDELVPLFERAGIIRQFRLMMDFSNTNRGFAFVQYSTSSEAKDAVKLLDGYEIRPGHTIGVMGSWDKCRLFIGGIQKNKTRKDVLKEMKRVTEGVKDVILYMSIYNNKNRGFCFVEYKSHTEAAMARRRMGPGFKLWNTCEIRVDWADPEPIIDDEIMSKVRILHVRNLKDEIDESELKEIFTFDGLHIERVKKIRDFAFIHFETREETEIALKFANSAKFHKLHKDFKHTQVSLARPQKCKSHRKRTESLPIESSQSGSTLGSNSPMFCSHEMFSSPQTQVDSQLKYYQNLCLTTGQNQMLTVPYSQQPLTPVPFKYDSIDDKNNFLFFVVWVPVWLPNNQNKSLTQTNSTFLYSNN